MVRPYGCYGLGVPRATAEKSPCKPISVRRNNQPTYGAAKVGGGGGGDGNSKGSGDNGDNGGSGGGEDNGGNSLEEGVVCPVYPPHARDAKDHIHREGDRSKEGHEPVVAHLPPALSSVVVAVAVAVVQGPAPPPPCRHWAGGCTSNCRSPTAETRSSTWPSRPPDCRPTQLHSTCRATSSQSGQGTQPRHASSLRRHRQPPGGRASAPHQHGAGKSRKMRANAASFTRSFKIFA